MSGCNRRSFIKSASLLGAGAVARLLLPRRLLGADAPSNRINPGLIGMGRQGFGQNLQGTNLKKFNHECIRAYHGLLMGMGEQVSPLLEPCMRDICP